MTAEVCKILRNPEVMIRIEAPWISCLLIPNTDNVRVCADGGVIESEPNYTLESYPQRSCSRMEDVCGFSEIASLFPSPYSRMARFIVADPKGVR